MPYILVLSYQQFERRRFAVAGSTTKRGRGSSLSTERRASPARSRQLQSLCSVVVELLLSGDPVPDHEAPPVRLNRLPPHISKLTVKPALRKSHCVFATGLSARSRHSQLERLNGGDNGLGRLPTEQQSGRRCTAVCRADYLARAAAAEGYQSGFRRPALRP